MPIFLKEESEQVANKLVEIPKEMVNKAKIVYNNIGERYPNDTKRIKKIAFSTEEDGTYNKKKGEDEIVNDNGKIFMKGSAIKKATQDLKSKNPNAKKIICNGGDEFKNFYKDKLNQIRRSVKEPEIVKQVKDCNKSATKVSPNPTKPIEVGDIKVNVHESKKIYVSEKQLFNLRKLNEDINGYTKKVYGNGFTNKPSLEGSFEERTSKANLDEVKELYFKNKQLQKIGTVDDYVNYVYTMFPNSKVKEPIYHGSNYKFSEFDFNRENGSHNYQGTHYVPCAFLASSPTIVSFYIDYLLQAKITNFFNKIFRPYKDIKQPTIYLVKANIENPAYFDYGSNRSSVDFEQVNNSYKNGNDCVIATNIKDGADYNGTVYVIFPQTKYVMLGSVYDITQFKEYMYKKQSNFQ